MTVRDHRDYIRVAVDIASNPKLVGLKAEAKWLHVVALCVAGRDLTDGHIRGRVVAAEADVPERFATALIKAGAWHGEGHDCDRCPQPDQGFLYIHDYLEHQRSRDEANRARRAGRTGAAARWGAKGNANRSANRNAEGNANRNANHDAISIAEVEVEVEVEKKGSVVSHSPAVGRGAKSDDGLDLDKITQDLNGDRTRAQRVAADILSRASRTPADPTAYVRSAIRAEPARYRATDGPPRLDQICTEHGRDRATCPASWHEEAS